MNKTKIYELLEKPGDSLNQGGWLRIGLLVLILLNVLSVILESVQALEESYGHLFRFFELFSVGVFSLEYLVRLWAINAQGEYARPWGRLRYIFSPMALVDALAVLPTLLSLNFVDLRFLRIARLFRLLRVLKIGRYSKTLRRFAEVAAETKTEMALTFLAMLLLLIIGSGLMYYAEHDAQPDMFSSIPATMWWAVATLTTVGYGDTYPITVLGKFVASFTAIIGIGMFALPSGILGAAFLERIRTEREGPIICPHCNRPINEHSDDTEKARSGRD